MPWRILTPPDSVKLAVFGGPGVWSRSLWLVGWSFNGGISALWCVPGYGRRRAWSIMVLPTHGTPFPFGPLHVRLVWCWPACVRSVQCRVVFSAAVWLVPGCVSRLMVGLCVVGSIALQRAPVERDVVLVVFPVSSAVCCGRPARCGGCGASRACPARCVGSPSSWPPVVGSSRGVRWPVWAWLAAFGRCRLSPTSYVSRRACFVVVRPVAACPRVRLLCCCTHFVELAVLSAA